MQPLRKVLVLLLSSALLLASCSTTQTVPELENLGRSRHSGIEIFKGLFFGEGKVATLFPEVWKNPEVQANRAALSKVERKKIEAAKRDLITFINKRAPSFFDRFGTELQSGDPLRVETALNEVYNHVIAFGEERGLVEDGTLTPQQCGPSAFCAVAAAVVVVLGNYIAVAHSVVIALALFGIVGVFSTSPSNTKASGAELAYDMYVARVTKQLAISAP